MKRWFWRIFFVASTAAMAATYFVLFTPKFGKAPATEIEALLPASLKGKDAPDLEGEKRYAQLVDLVLLLNTKPLNTFATPPDPLANQALPENEAILAKIETLLEQGPLRTPARTREMQLPDLAKLKNAAKLMAVSTKAAQERNDHTACARWASLGLRYTTALQASGGIVIDQLVDIALQSIALRAAYLAELKGGFDAAGRTRLIALLKPQDGVSPDMAQAVRRDFQTYWLDILLDPPAHEKELRDANFTFDEEGDSTPPPFAGTFDPRASATLAGGIYDAIITDLLHPPSKAVHAEGPLLAAAERFLPSTSTNRGPEGLWYRVRMNLGSNTLGRQMALYGSFIALTDATTRAATHQDLIRAVFLLRMGAKPSVVDPYDAGKLRFDPKRKIVWSVGKDGRDDRGDIKKGFQNDAPDLGYPYGDNSWEPLHPVVTPGKSAPLPGSPPPGFVPGSAD